MLTKPMIHILTQASLNQLPRFIDGNTPGIDLQAFKELFRAGLLSAIDASADCGDGFLEPVITIQGRQLLSSHSSALKPWWASFDRRVMIIGLIVAVVGLAATFGLHVRS